MRQHFLVRVTLAIAIGIAATGCTRVSETGVESGGAGRSTAASSGNNGPLKVSAGAAAKLVPSEIRAQKTLKVATDPAYAPFEFFASDNTTMVGFDIDLAKAIAMKLGLKVVHVNSGFDTILTGLDSGKYDLGMSFFAVTAERAKSFDFVTYLVGGSGIAVQAGNPLNLRMDASALCGRTISAVNGSLQGMMMLPSMSKECVARHAKPIGIRLYPSQNDAKLAVSSGRVNAVMANASPLKYSADNSAGALMLAPGPEYKPGPSGIALRKGSKLTGAVAAAIDELVADGTFDAVMKKWGIPSQEKSKETGKVTR